MQSMISVRAKIAIAILFILLCPIINLHAESPREQLKALVAQLQGNPGDNALREQIIKLAQGIDPAPAVPEEAERHLGRGQAAFEIAKEPADFDKAIAEFQVASNTAPWLAAPYYNLGIAQEKANKYQEAMASFRMYLLAAPAAADASEVKQRIFKIEYLAEQPPAPPSDEELLKKVDGAKFIKSGVSVPVDSIGESGYEINGKSIYSIRVKRELGPDDRQYNPHMLNQWVRMEQQGWVYKGNLIWETPREKVCIEIFATWESCQATTFTISADGQTLTIIGFSYSDRQMYTVTYPRVN